MAGVIQQSGKAEWLSLYRHMPTTSKDTFYSLYQRGDTAGMAQQVERDRTAGKYWSKHQKAAAFDVRTNDLTPAQVKTTVNALKAIGTTSMLMEPSTCWKKPSYERKDQPGSGKCRREHIHVNIPSRYMPNT
jgi:intein-encoded DNA endonuclease-like protein